MGIPIIAASGKFSLGLIVATQGAIQILSSKVICIALRRHISGDWGTLDECDHEANEPALQNGNRLLSLYHTEAGERFYVISEHDRSATTVLLSDDY